MTTPPAALWTKKVPTRNGWYWVRHDTTDAPYPAQFHREQTGVWEYLSRAGWTYWGSDGDERWSERIEVPK